MANLSVTLNDVDVSADVVLALGISVEQALGRRWTASFALDVFGDYVGQRVGVYYGAARLFGGTVQDCTHEVDSLTDPAAPYAAYRLACTSWETRLDSKFVNNAVYGQVFYADDAADTLNSRFHGLSNGQQLQLVTNDTLPAGLSPNTTYWVRDVAAHSFKLAATFGGSAIDITDAGTGTHRYTWLARDIASHLVNTFAAGEGIDMGAGDIDDGDFLNPIVIGRNRGVSVAAALDEIAKACGFIWHLGPDLEFNFKARSTTAAPFTIDNDNVLSLGFSYRKTRQDYRNRQLIVGSFAGLVPEEETFTGDGTAAQWWLGSRAEAIESITVDGVTVTIGIDGVDADQEFYWSPGEYNLRAETAPVNGASIVIRYRALGSNTYVVEDTGEQAARAAIEGGTGIYENVIDDTDNVDALGSVAKAQSVLDANKFIAEEIRYETDVAGLMVGQLQSVIISSQGINGNYLIDQISIVAWSTTLVGFTVRALGGNHLDDYLDYFKGLKGGIGGALGVTRATGGGSGGSGSNSYTDEQTLTANMVDYAGPASPAVGSFLELDIIQGSGPYTWTWDAAQFAADTPTNITDVDGGRTHIRFIRKSDDLWHVTSWYSAA